MVLRTETRAQEGEAVSAFAVTSFVNVVLGIVLLMALALAWSFVKGPAATSSLALGANRDHLEEQDSTSVSGEEAPPAGGHTREDGGRRSEKGEGHYGSTQ